MTSDLGGAPATNQEERPVAATTPLRKRFGVKGFLLLFAAVIALAALALILVPPFPKGGQPGQACDYPACFINSVLEFPPPAVVLDFSPATAPAVAPLVYFHPSISSTILTMWIVMALILLLAFLATRRMRQKPGRVQNAIEWAYEFGSNFAVGIGGERARRYYPIFAAFFLFILFSNWSGLVPPVGRIEQLRAPTSDVNITIGLALTSFVLFQGEGFRRLGLRGYLGKFFPIGEFRNGVGTGILAMYVGMIELFLEFVKPVTLSMRLFGNIYGGEVALAVISGLAVAIVPVVLLGLEAFLNLIQALIFSILTLVFITMAIEGHEYEEHGQASAAASADHTRNGADSPQTATA